MEPLLSVAIITYNEEKKLGDCLASVRFADEIVVVDSGSVDRTREIAQGVGAKVSIRKFDNFAAQKNDAIEKTSGRWILLLDADERLTPDLQDEVKRVIASPDAMDAYFVRRRNFLFGRELRFGANGNDWQLRLLRRGSGRFAGLVHERVVPPARTGRLQAPLLHYSTQSSADYAAKLPLFTSLEAEALWKEGRRPGWLQLFVKPPLHFVLFYFCRLGFLDGIQGLRYELLSSRYLYVKYAKARSLFRERAPR